MQDTLINLGLITALIIVSEIVARTTLLNPRVLRKAMHIATGGVVILGSYLTDYKSFILVGVLMTLALIAQHYLLPLKSLQDRFNTSHGEVYFALGVAIAALICPTLTGFVAGVLTLTLADTAAYFIGSHFSSPELYRTKTVAGSLTCLVVTLIIFVCFSYGWGISLIIAFYVATAELLSGRGADNLTMPVMAALLLAFI